jgi:hypothetical protein
VALSVAKAYWLKHPRFHMADHPALPGLSSPAETGAIEQPVFKDNDLFGNGFKI